MAPADVPEIASIFIHGSSSRRSRTPHVKAPWEPPPCKARSIRTVSREASNRPVMLTPSSVENPLPIPRNSKTPGVVMEGRPSPGLTRPNTTKLIAEVRLIEKLATPVRVDLRQRAPDLGQNRKSDPLHPGSLHPRKRITSGWANRAVLLVRRGFSPKWARPSCTTTRT